MLGRDALALAALAIAVRVAFQAASGFYEAPETWEEGEIALRLARGDGYAYELNGTLMHALRGPTYSFALAAFYVVFGSTPPVAGSVQALLGGALAVLCYAIARDWHGVAAGRLSGVAVALHPPLVIYAAKVHQLNLDVVLVALGVLLLMRAGAARGTSGALPLGLAAGVAALSRATFAPVFAIGALMPGRTWRQRVAFVSVAILAAALVVVPWSVRNQMLLGTPVPTTTTGYLLWIGNSPAATGSTITADGRSILDASPEVRDRIWAQDEREQDRVFLALATIYMAEDPARTVRLFFAKLGAFWWFAPTTGTRYPGSWLVLYGAQYVATLLLAAVGAVWAARRSDRWPLVVVLLSLAAISIAQSVFYVDGRHRWAVEPLLLILAAIGLVRLAVIRRAAPRS